ncbi:MAG: hypothetical protein QXI12_05270 [Candidatus Methanomethyliaceae archaeon]
MRPRRIGYVLQAYNLILTFTVLDNIAFIWMEASRSSKAVWEKSRGAAFLFAGMTPGPGPCGTSPRLKEG